MKQTLNLRLVIEPTVHYHKSGKACLRIVGYHKPVTSNGFVKGPSRRVTSFAYGSLAKRILKAHLSPGTLVRAELKNSGQGGLFCNNLSVTV